MRVRVRFFAAPREQLRLEQTWLDLPPGATVDVARHVLYERYPVLENYALQFAVNAVYATLDTPLQEGDEIACIPPVGGG